MAETITIPGNEHVFAVTVRSHEGGEEWKHAPVPGMVVLESHADLFGPTITLRVDGQALADALAKLGYRAGPDTSRPRGTDTAIADLLRRVAFLENRVDALEHTSSLSELITDVSALRERVEAMEK